MSQAFWASLVAASSLLIGAVIAIRWEVGRRMLGIVMAFGAGVLISAVAYDLVADAQELANGDGITIGLIVGAVAFYVGDLLIDRAGGDRRKRSTQAVSGGAPTAIVLGTVLDGVPESIVLGLTLLNGEGIGWTVLIAIFLSNLPEAIAATTGLVASGHPVPRVLAMWALVALVSASSAAFGYAALGDAEPSAIAFVQAFAAGAILTMLADTMMPEAFEEGGPVVGLATTIGFAAAFALVTLERA